MLSPAMTDDARTRRRFPCHVRFMGASATSIHGEVQDLSSEGLCLLTRAKLEKGSLLHLSFQLPSGSVEVVGEVRWVKPLGDLSLEVGIRFARISSSAQATIAAALTARPFVSKVMRDYVFA